jgi:hypothetical protein
MGQRATAIRVKFRPGSPSTLGEKVASGLVLRFDTIDCVNDNLAYSKNGFDDSGSFLDVGEHCFYVAITKPFPEEVHDVFDPLGDAGWSCSKSSNLGAMGDDKGGDLPCTARPPLECLLPQEQAAPLPEKDILDVAIMVLRAPLDLTIDPIKAAEALERTRIALLGKVANIEDNRHRVSCMLHEFYVAQGSVLAEEARGPRYDRDSPATGPRSPQAQQASSPNKGQEEHTGRSGGSHRAQRSRSHGRDRRDPTPIAGPGA